MHTKLFARTLRAPSSHPALAAAALAVALSWPLAARAGDSTPPVIEQTPPRAVAGQPVHVTAHITDESRIFPQLFFRYGQSGGFEAPIDLKKVRGVKDEYEAIIPYKPGPIDYYLECYDEFGNGPARAGSPEAPLHVGADKSDESAATADTALTLPGSASSDRVVAQPAAPSTALPPDDSGPRATGSSARLDLSGPLLTTQLTTSAAPLSAGAAAWHSAILPGWGQYRSQRRLRGVAFGVATGASLIATLWLTVRAHQANTIYMEAPLSVRSQAYDQAVDYANARNSLLGVTIGLWAANVAEAYFFHGTKDPW